MRKGDGSSVNALNLMVGALLGGGVAAAVAVLALLVCAAAITAGILSEKLELHAAVASCVIGSFCGGRMTCRRWGGRNLFAGLSAGAVLFLLLLTIGLIGTDTADISGTGIGILAASLCGGGAAGLLGQGRGGRKKRRRAR